jgi:ribonuclease III
VELLKLPDASLLKALIITRKNMILDLLEKKIDYDFNNKSLLQLALTHRSSSNENFERLEFLGDAIIGAIVSAKLYELHPEVSEGQLTKMRAATINRESLASMARMLELDTFIRIDDHSDHLRQNTKVLCNIFESVIGAVFLDSDFNTTTHVFLSLFAKELAEIEIHDPKTELQEFLQKTGQERPEYILEKTEGPSNEQTFYSAVLLGDKVVAHGQGKTKKLSEQSAALQALELICLTEETQNKGVS